VLPKLAAALSFLMAGIGQVAWVADTKGANVVSPFGGK